MSILIKGMEMPKNCGECLLNGFICCNLTNTKFELGKIKNDDCPLLELPPHGRLIDADALLDMMLKLVDEETFMAFCQAVNDAPTIIEVEGEDDSN